ncbi:MAG: pyruvate kinase [Lachnospiraceae bacterium]|nr:pyruvate kinase [Lachnospiraceae bacterium]
MKKTKIICTLGPNTNDKETLKQLATHGMNIARINMSHGDYADKEEMIKLVKEVREELNLPIAILLDTKGPEIRTGCFENGGIDLEEGQLVRLTTEDILGGEGVIPVSYKDLPKDVEIGRRVLLDDGLIELKPMAKTETTIDCEVIAGGHLSDRKGINLPNIKVNLPFITEKDKEDIIFGVKHNIDFIAASFVRGPEAVLEIKEILKDNLADGVDVIAKIENQEGVDNIDAILEVADGIMVARGDLGVEIPVEEVPFVQKELIHKANKVYKPVITATQMLDSMIRNPRPTRAEVTDVANAIYDGTDAIMLSGETAVGKYPVDAVQIMSEIALATESHLDQDFHMKKRKFRETKDVSSAVAFSSVATAMNVNAKYILCSSMSGQTARVVSKFHPECPIIGLSPIDSTLRKMQIYWGVIPIKTPHVSHSEEILNVAVDTVKESHLVKEDDVVVITAGSVYGKYSITNIMKVFII